MKNNKNFQITVSIPLFLSLFFLSIAFISQYFVPLARPTKDGFPWLSQSYNLPTFLQKISQTWDTKHFVSIAEGGYKNEDPRLSQKTDCGAGYKCGLGKNYLYAFFPLYPIILWLFSQVLPNFLTPVLVAFLLYIIYANLLKRIFFYHFNLKSKPEKMVENLIETEPLPELFLNKILLISLLLPFSVFFLAPYTETLYLSIFFSIFFFWIKSNFKKRDFAVLFFLAFLLGLSRSVAVILPISIFVFLIFKLVQNKFNFSKFYRIFKLEIFKFFTISAGVGLAFLSFFYYGFIKTGNFFVSRGVQEHWGRGSTHNLLEPIIRGIKDIIFGKSHGVGVIMIFAFLFLSVLVFQKYKTHILSKSLYFIMFFYSIFAIILPLTSNSTASINRYILATPVYFFFLPIFINDFLQQKFSQKMGTFLLNLLLFLFGLFLAFTSILWSNHYWLG